MTITDVIAISDVRRAVDMMHGRSRLLQSVPVEETFPGGILWEGTVHLFDALDGSRLYVWFAPARGTDEPKFWMIPHDAQIASPGAAVRSVIMPERPSD